MTLLHPARAGSRISMFFVHGTPVRLVSGTVRFRVIGEPKCADFNGTRYWRLRALSPSGQHGTFDVRESPGGWILDGVEDDAEVTPPRPSRGRGQALPASGDRD